MTPKMASKDPVIRGSLAAMRRAARAAKALAIKTGTPLYVWKDGRIINLNPKGRLKKTDALVRPDRFGCFRFMNAHQDKLRKRLGALKPSPPPLPWTMLKVLDVGGLTDVGVSPDSKHLLVVTHDGRGVFNVGTGERLARDSSPPSADWYEPYRLTAYGIGPLNRIPISLAGLSGGGLARTTNDGWSLEVVYPNWPEATVVLAPPGASIFLDDHADGCIALDAGGGEFRAAGFSPDGRTLIVASTADLTLIRRA